MEKEFVDFKLKFSIGGQISFDVFPIGWDKTYCIQHLNKFNFKEIHFFGDKTEKGGNDYEIFHAEGIQGHATKGPDDTIAILTQLWLQKDNDI